MTKLTQEKLKEIIHYDPDTGVFTWKIDLVKFKKGDPVKAKVQVEINGGNYPIHRLAYLYMTGEFPKRQLTFADGNKLNKKWNNIIERHPVKESK